MFFLLGFEMTDMFLTVFGISVFKYQQFVSDVIA